MQKWHWTMHPVFDHPDAFNPAYLRLADIDGSGTSDIIYLGKNKFTCWKNLSGNRFGTIPFEIDPFPEIHSQSKMTVTIYWEMEWPVLSGQAHYQKMQMLL